MASIQKRSEGVWRARYRDAAGREHARHFARKIDAQRWLDETTAAVVTGTYVDPAAGVVTLSDYFVRWSARQVWERGTLDNARLAVNSTPFRHTPLKSIRRSDVEAWVKSLTAKFAPSTVATRYKHLRQVFVAAVRDKLITHDPAEGVVLPRQRRSEHRMVIPTPGEVAQLLDATGPGFRPFVALGAFAGLRRGEAQGVQVDDVDFLRKLLHVRRQVQRTDSGSVVRLPKFGSERTVPIPNGLVTILAEHVRLFGVHSDGWLFIGRDGPITSNSAQSRWSTACRAAGVSGVTLHSLRHFFASGLIAQGCDVVTVQRALGHASPAITLTAYAHLWPNAEDRTRSAAAALMGEVEKNTAAPADSRRTEDPLKVAD